MDELWITHLVFSVCKRTRPLLSGIITSTSYQTCLHLPRLNLRALLTEVDGVKTTDLSGKLLGLVGRSGTTNDSILESVSTNVTRIPGAC